MSTRLPGPSAPCLRFTDAAVAGGHVLRHPKGKHRKLEETRRDPVTVAPGQSNLSQGLEVNSWGASDHSQVPPPGLTLV